MKSTFFMKSKNVSNLNETADQYIINTTQKHNIYEQQTYLLEEYNQKKRNKINKIECTF